MPDRSFMEQFEQGSSEYSLCVWLNAVEHDLTELQTAVGYLKLKAIEILDDGEAMKKQLREDVKKKGEERMDEIEDALAANPL
jgi:hypothetical protein